jgi:hypothetical protein
MLQKANWVPLFGYARLSLNPLTSICLLLVANKQILKISGNFMEANIITLKS